MLKLIRHMVPFMLLGNGTGNILASAAMGNPGLAVSGLLVIFCGVLVMATDIGRVDG